MNRRIKITIRASSVAERDELFRAFSELLASDEWRKLRDHLWQNNQVIDGAAIEIEDGK